MSPPKVDPVGGFTLHLFEMGEWFKSGSAGSLQARAAVLDTPPGAVGFPPAWGRASS